jgi:RimJ/RimL family protein N-acetyltransferase
LRTWEAIELTVIGTEVSSMVPRLRTTNYEIRAFERKDLEIFSSYRAQEEVARYQSWTHYTYQDAIELFADMDYSSFGGIGNWYQLAISTLGSEILVGDLAVHFIDEHQVEIGFTVDPSHQRENVATESLNCLLDYLFSTLGKHRVVARTDTKNIGAYRLLEKLGFRREGHYIQNIFFKGAWDDEYQYAMLNGEQKFI